MFRFLRLRYILLYILLFVGYTHFDARWILERPVAGMIAHRLDNMGFKNARFQIVSLTMGHITIDGIKLDHDNVNTIDRVHVTYSPFGLIFGRVNDITIEKPDFIFSADSPPPIFIPTTPGQNQNSKNPFLLSTLPFKNLKVNDLSLAYAGDNINPGVTGNINIQQNDRGDRELSFIILGAQKDLSLNITGTMTEKPDHTLHFLVDIKDARFDIPNILMMSRAHGTFDITIPSDSPLSANGEWVAGAMRIGTVPLDNISLVIQGRKPDFSLIGNADITGLPQSNISLRLSEGQNGAQLIAQISGNSPQKMLAVMSPASKFLLPDNQKFVATLDLKDADLTSLFTAPHDGGLFIYNDDAAPFLSMSLNCPEHYKDCAVTVPKTTLKTQQISQFLGPALADFGAILESGLISFSGNVRPFDPAQIPLPYNFHVTSNNLSMNWKGADLSNFKFDVTRDATGHIDMKPLSANIMNGRMTTTPLVLSPDGSGSTTATLNNIDLSMLSQFVRVEGLELSGKASGKIPMRFTSWTPTFDQGGKIDGLKGNIKYIPSQYPGFLTGDSNHIKILRDTLQDYMFDTLNLNFTGDPFGAVKATLAAKGRNENLFQDRPIHINLNIDGPLAPAIQQLIPYMGNDNPNEQDTPP